jgi:urease beta subunit
VTGGAPAPGREPMLVPGEVLVADGTLVLNAGRPRIELLVENGGDRPVQVGSHYHFAAANPALMFDRDLAWGRRLDIPAGTSVRFEPGLSKVVGLVPIGGRRVVPGLRPEQAGPLDLVGPTGVTGPPGPLPPPGPGAAIKEGESRG